MSFEEIARWMLRLYCSTYVLFGLNSIANVSMRPWPLASSGYTFGKGALVMRTCLKYGSCLNVMLPYVE